MSVNCSVNIGTMIRPCTPKEAACLLSLGPLVRALPDYSTDYGSDQPPWTSPALDSELGDHWPWSPRGV